MKSCRLVGALAGVGFLVALWSSSAPETFLQVSGAPSSLVASSAAPRISAAGPRRLSALDGGSSCGVAPTAIAALTLLAAAAAGSRRRGSIACRASAQQVRVMDLKGNQIGEETMNFRTLSEETANYVVHQVVNIWIYQQKKFGAYAKRRGDKETKKGPKPWPQKGSGRARQGSRYSPHFGRSCTNKGPHGLDNRRKKRADRSTHHKAISTALQSKWRSIYVVDGLEDAFPEPRHNQMMDFLRDVTSTEPGRKSMLMITRHGYGKQTPFLPFDRSGMQDPLYMSGRLVPRLEMRRPRDIDPTGDGLFQVLKGRRIIISRPAFFDLKAKFDAEEGWAWASVRDILVAQMNKIIEDYPMDRHEEIRIANELPKTPDEREKWARNLRKKMALESAE